MSRYLSYLLMLSILVTGCQPLAVATLATPTIPPLPTSTFAPTPTSPPSTKTPVVKHTSSGYMWEDETWSGNILIRGDIIIRQGVTLTIEPGTTVKFTAQNDFWKNQPGGDVADYQVFPNDPPQNWAKMIEIEIWGTLIAQGTPDKPIIFTSDSTSPALNDWGAIIMGEKGKMLLTYSIIEYNYNGVVLDAENMDVEIHHNIFRHIAACGICTGGWEHAIYGPIIISNNIFEDIHHEGIDTYSNHDLIIKNNLFANNVVGIIANEGSTVQIEGNVFQGNESAIGIINNSTPVIHNNNFFENETNIGTHNSNLLVDAENNWFNSTDVTQIRKLIRGNIDYEPFAIVPFEIEIGLPFELQER